MKSKKNKRLTLNILILALFGILFSLFSCFQHCMDCSDNLSAIYKNSKYKDKDIVVFVNSESIERTDTVALSYTPVPDHYCYSTLGEEPRWEIVCVGQLHVRLSNYEAQYKTNETSQGKLSASLFFFGINLEKQGYKSESFDYSYNGSIVKTKHFMLADTTNIHKKVYCTDCNIALDSYKLYSFSIYNQGMFENWKLK